jgi:hypothetical protein
MPKFGERTERSVANPLLAYASRLLRQRQIYIADTESVNGTYLDGQRLGDERGTSTLIELHTGDELVQSVLYQFSMQLTFWQVTGIDVTQGGAIVHQKVAACIILGGPNKAAEERFPGDMRKHAGRIQSMSSDLQMRLCEPGYWIQGGLYNYRMMHAYQQSTQRVSVTSPALLSSELYALW